ncbi:MAG TPA: glycosyltransferase [Flavobacterium sp.]|jgi:uncharacterized protein (TIGR00661 family)
MQNPEKNILVAPLNWGLGHATRCIPIIRALIETGYNPILASDGSALQLLKKEFPLLTALELPSYDITYPEDGKKFKWKMLQNAPKMIEAIRIEKKMVKKWVREYDLCGIISDNRLGVISKKVHSVFITHQIKVLSGNTTWISSKLHRYIIDQFDECWIPDAESKPNLSGKLGHLKNPRENISYIGPLSRFESVQLPVKYDLMVLLSGPEPQRSYLENILRDELSESHKKTLFIKGIVDDQQHIEQTGNITYYNYMDSAQLQQALNESKLVVCRSGYTSVMDLAKLRKKCFFVPTPGQFEQEYLAKRLTAKGFVASCNQEDFTLGKLLEADLYSGLPQIEHELHWKNLFCLLERK